MMKEEYKKGVTCMAVICTSALVMVSMLEFITDFFSYQSILEGTYNTPWYSKNWLEEPYTNLRLIGAPTRVYATTNAIGSQMWIVREKTVGTKKFWTIDYKLNITTNNL